jgi:hypothetical protein
MTLRNEPGQYTLLSEHQENDCESGLANEITACFEDFEPLTRKAVGGKQASAKTCGKQLRTCTSNEL